MNSKVKGAEGERELARFLRDFGYNARRGVQFSGANGDPDVLGLPGIHIECKRVERLNVQDAMDQSRRDARETEVPVVIHRRNYCEWLITMRLEDWIPMYAEWRGENG